jgi:WD40 repeat protein
LVNNRKYKDRFLASLPTERENYYKLNRFLPKGVTMADEINKFIEERGQELEREQNNISIEFSPIKSIDYDDNNNNIRDTTLDEYIPIYEDDSKRFKKLYSMNQKELAEYGHTVNDHLTEVSSIMWSRFKVTAFLNRQVDTKIVEKAKKIVYGRVDNNHK